MAYGIQLTGQLPERCARNTSQLCTGNTGNTAWLIAMYAIVLVRTTVYAIDSNPPNTIVEDSPQWAGPVQCNSIARTT